MATRLTSGIMSKPGGGRETFAADHLHAADDRAELERTHAAVRIEREVAVLEVGRSRNGAAGAE